MTNLRTMDFENTDGTFNSSPTGDYFGEPTLFSELKPTISTRGEGFGAAFRQAFFTGPTANLSFDAEFGWDDFIQPGKRLSEDEWRNSEFFRKGLSFPQGVNENIAKLVSRRFDANQERQSIMNTMSPGFLSSTSKFLGEAIGTTLDPINAASFALAPELIGTRAAPMLEATTARFAAPKFVGGLAVGSIEGATALAPSQIVELPTSKLTQENETWADVLTNLGLGAALGGVIHASVTGLKGDLKVDGSRVGGIPVIAKDANDVVKQTAVGLLDDGKSVDLESTIKNGEYVRDEVKKQSIRDGLQPTEDEQAAVIDESNRNLNEDLKNQSLDVKDSYKELEDNIRKEDFKSDIDNLNTLKTPHEENIKALLEGGEISKLKAQKATTQELLKTELPEDRIENLQEDLKDINKQLSGHEQAKVSRLEIERLDRKIGKVKKLQDDLVNRANNLNVLRGTLEESDVTRHPKLRELRKKLEDDLFKVEATPSSELDKNFTRLDKSEEQLRETRDSIVRNRQYLDLLNSDKPPVRFSDVKENSDRVHSTDGLAEVNPKEIKDFTDFVDTLGDEVPDDEDELLKFIDEMIDDDKLPKETRNEIKEVQETISKAAATISDAVKAARDCLIGFL